MGARIPQGIQFMHVPVGSYRCRSDQGQVHSVFGGVQTGSAISTGVHGKAPLSIAIRINDVFGETPQGWPDRWADGGKAERSVPF